MQTDRFYLELAMQEADLAAREGTAPIGAVIVGPDGRLLGKGRNRIYSAGDYTAHAEIEAIRDAGGRLMTHMYRKQAILYTTLEPCLMCTGALLNASIARVVWLMDDAIWGGSLRALFRDPIPLLGLARPILTHLPEADLVSHMNDLIQQWLTDGETWKARWWNA